MFSFFFFFFNDTATTEIYTLSLHDALPISIGTNIAIRDVIGNILQDEKIPGVHIAFGNPYGAHTGADWYSSTHIDVVGRKFDIWIDGRQIMHAGVFLLDSLAPPAI